MSKLKRRKRTESGLNSALEEKKSFICQTLNFGRGQGYFKRQLNIHGE